MDMVASFVLTILIARHLGPERYGVYTFAIWIGYLVVGFANIGIKNAIIKFIAETHSRDVAGEAAAVWGKLRKMQLVSLLITLVIFALLVPLVFAPRIAPAYQLALWFALLGSAAKALHIFYMSFAKGIERFKAIAMVSLWVTPINVALVAIGVATGQDIVTFAAIYAVVSVLNIGLMVFVLRQDLRLGQPTPLRPTLNQRINRHVIYMSLLALVSYLAMHRLEVFFLSIYASTEDIGFFNLAYSLAAWAPNLLPGLLDFLLLPLMAKTFAAAPDRLAARLEASVRYKLILSMPIALIGAYYAPTIIDVLYGADYLPAVLPLQLFMLLVISNAFGGPATAYLVASDHQKITLYLSLGAAILNIALDLLLIPKFGLAGAVFATLLSMLGKELSLLTAAMILSKAAPAFGPWLRILLAGIGALVVAAAICPNDQTLLSLVIASSIFFAVFGFLSVLFGCWNEGDLAFFRDRLGHFPGSGLGLLPLLNWASKRRSKVPFN